MLKYTSPSGVIVSTVKVPFTRWYQTIIFNSRGEEIFCRNYSNIKKENAIKWHEYYVNKNSK